MKPEFILNYAVEGALELLPAKMNSARAKALEMAIGFQESQFEHRFQLGGPARGYWQFERGGGVLGVMTHPASKQHSVDLLTQLDYSHLSDSNTVYNALAHNDVLAAGFARLLLWTHPDTLPSPTQSQKGWDYYTDCWRPGKPHPEDWEDNWKQAWQLVGSST